MLNLREYRNTVRGLPDVLNFALEPEDGIIQTKSGGLLACWYFRGRDTGSSTHAELASISTRLNAILCLLGEGWMLHADAIRRPANNYPERGSFPDRTTLIIDEERRQQFKLEGAHYETFYGLTLTYHPPKKVRQRVADSMYEGGNHTGEGLADRILAQFRKTIDDFESVFSGLFPARRMRGIKGVDDFGREYVMDEQLQYLEYCVSGQQRPVRLPSIPMYLDAVIGGHEFVGGNEPKVGDKWIKVVALDGFAQESYPGILNTLDDLAVEYRWSTRFIFYEPYRAKKMLDSIRKKWSQKQRGLKDQVLNTSKGPVDLDALAMTADVEAAMSEAESNLVKFGNYTSVVVLMNDDYDVVQEDARKVVKAIMNAGYGARVEGPNAVEAYLGSIPGHHRQNVRRPLLHTLNLSDMLPITSIWAGLEHNPCDFYPKNSPALCYAATTGSTPFRVNLHVGDVGHTLLLGKTGGGKSTALTFKMAQHFRYPRAQVFAFDKGYSAFVLTKAAGGDHYDIGGEHSQLAFCPLGGMKHESDVTWGVGWVEDLLRFQGVDVGSTVTKTITQAVQQHANAEIHEGAIPSLTNFVARVQSTELRTALEPYTIAGTMGHLLDAETDGLRYGRFQTFELEHLLDMGEKNYAPVLLYLFRQIEKRLMGAPTLVPIDEAWMALMVEMFRDKVADWLRTWRKKNAAIILATQNISDALNSPLRDVLLANCPTKILLPNPDANTSTFLSIYRDIGLNEREIDILANATEKRQYYYTSPLGRRLYSYGFGQVALSFIGASGQDDIKLARQLMNSHGETWPAEWLRHRGLGEWSDYWMNVQ